MANDKKITSYVDNYILFGLRNSTEVGYEFTVCSVTDGTYYTDLVVTRTSTRSNGWVINVEFGELKGSQIKSSQLSLKRLKYMPIVEIERLLSKKHDNSVKCWEGQ